MHNRSRQLVMVAVAILLGGGVGVLMSSSPSSARGIIKPCSYDDRCIDTTRAGTSGIDDTGTVKARGHQAAITGHLECPSAEHFYIEVTVTQGDVEAFGARGGSCSGGLAPWHVQTSTSGDGQLTTGPAEVCAIFESYAGSTRMVGRKWCKTVQLVAG
jgi:hypothetical protein